MPWEALVKALKTGIVPASGKLWAIGCESIKYSELEELKMDLAPYAKIIYEPLQTEPTKFIDPLSYVFLAEPIDVNNQSEIIVLVQFKTYPMGDNDHIEVNSMQRGTLIYQFGEKGSSIRLISLICSDAFAFLDTEAAAIYDRALVIHIQMNPKPRHEQFRMYRDRLLKFHGDQTELICLNWARDVREWHDTRIDAWNNISASAWYLKSNKFDQRDETLIANHHRGLYYTWLKSSHVHTLFFNYEPATYLLQATKVAHIGVPAAISRRRGPQLTKTSVWDDKVNAWIEQVSAKNGFAAIIAESGRAKDNIEQIANRNPFEAERILALCAGKINHSENWHSVHELDSCKIEISEVIHRITFCQDTDENACIFRIARLKRCGHLWTILTTDQYLPPALADFKNDFCFEWISSSPHQNLKSVSGKRATVIYMGEDSSYTEIQTVFKKAAEYLHRAFTDPDKNHDARQRLAIWYRDNENQIIQYGRDRFIDYNNPGNTSEVYIGREQ